MLFFAALIARAVRPQTMVALREQLAPKTERDIARDKFISLLLDLSRESSVLIVALNKQGVSLFPIFIQLLL